MRFEALSIEGSALLHYKPDKDERGSFTRVFCVDEFRLAGFPFSVVQVNTSHNSRQGTLRGLHVQVAPHEETKLVRCLRGRVQDVIVDLRAGSPTCGRWHAIELQAGDNTAVLVPTGCAHGFLTLADDAELEYLMSAREEREAAAGIRWDDPSLGIAWVGSPSVMSPRDRGFRDVDLALIRENGARALLDPGDAA